MRDLWRSYLYEGIAFIILGGLALALPGFFTLTLELLLGSLFVIAGFALAYRTYALMGKTGFWASVFSTFLVFFVGIWMLAFPTKGMFTLTFILALFYLLDGCAKMIFAVQMNIFKNWFWIMISGMLEVFIALLIWKGWPSSGIWAVGILVGVNLLVSGFTQVIIAYNVRDAID